MCGIFGIINSTTRVKSSCGLQGFMVDSFIASGVRGLDSAGLFQVDGKKKVWYNKMAVNGSTFIENKQTKAILDDAHLQGVNIGHVRKATEGRVRPDNAHPFITDTHAKTGHYMAGVHNGSISNWKGKSNASNYEVDSEWAINEMYEKGIAPTIKEITGAYVFVLYDSREDDLIKIVRNDTRTLYYAYATEVTNGERKRIKCMLVASEAGMLHWLAVRNGIVLEPKIYEFEPGCIYEISIKDVEDVKKTKLEQSVPPTTGGGNGTTNRRPFGDRFRDDGYYRTQRAELFSAVRKALTGKYYDSPARGEVTRLTPKPKKDEEKSENVKNGLVTAEEEHHALLFGELDEQMDFTPLQTGADGTVFGTVEFKVNGEICAYQAELRGMTYPNAKILQGKSKEVKAYVIGVAYAPAIVNMGDTGVIEEDGLVELVYILTNPIWSSK